jgi:hypothetical protein
MGFLALLLLGFVRGAPLVIMSKLLHECGTETDEEFRLFVVEEGLHVVDDMRKQGQRFEASHVYHRL